MDTSSDFSAVTLDTARHTVHSLFNSAFVQYSTDKYADVWRIQANERKRDDGWTDRQADKVIHIFFSTLNSSHPLYGSNKWAF